MGKEGSKGRPADPIRRGLLGIGGLLVADIFLGAQLGVAVGLLRGRSTDPQVAPLKLSESLVIPPGQPGWIEANISAPFIQAERGHLQFLREGIFNNPLILELTKEFFGLLLEKKEKRQRLSMGDMLRFVISRAYEELPREINIGTRKLEAVHAGLFALAGGLATSWFSEADLNRLGVSIEGYKDVNAFYWHTTGLGTIVFPEFFGVERMEDDRWLTDNNRASIFGGTDRAVHVAHHMFLTFNYLYAKHFNLLDNRSIPEGLKMVLNAQRIAGRIRTDEQEAYALSGLAGRAYEISTTPRSIAKWFRDKKERIIEGLFDEMVWADLKADDLGAEIGSALWTRCLGGLPIAPVIDQLRDINKFSRG